MPAATKTTGTRQIEKYSTLLRNLKQQELGPEEDELSKGIFDDEEDLGENPSLEDHLSNEVDQSRSNHDREASLDAFESNPSLENESESPDVLKSSLRTISFGALSSAASSLPQTKHRAQPLSAGSIEKASSLHQRLSEIRNTPHSFTKTNFKDKNREKEKRSSKHAPTTQSSKRAVPRARPIEGLVPSQTQSQPRDPRFSSAPTSTHQNQSDLATATRSRYAFLSSYRECEVKDMQTALASITKREKSGKRLTEEEVAEREELKREIGRERNRMREEERRAEVEALVRGHRQKERVRVEGGKRPFWLKRGVVRELVEKEREGKKKKGDGKGGGKVVGRVEKREKRGRKGMPVRIRRDR